MENLCSSFFSFTSLAGVGGRSNHGYPQLPMPLSSECEYFLRPSPFCVTDPQGLINTRFSFRFPSVRCFYLMEQSYESVCRWNSLNLLLLVRALFWFQRNLNNIILIVYDFVVGGFSLNDNREHIVAQKVNLLANDVIVTTFGGKSYYIRDLYDI